MIASRIRTTRAAVASMALASMATACGSGRERPKEPMGAIPSVVTTAQPEWIPFSIRAGKPVQADPRERHLRELRQLTFGGENAEAYFSPDGKSIVFQSTRDGASCDQIYVMDLHDGSTRRLSSGEGRTTCAFYLFPKGERIVYSSTHALGAACPPKPDRSQGYVWPLDAFDVYSSKVDGSDRKPLIQGPGYDAETTVAFDGSRLVFTSTRDGDLELYVANVDGTNVRRITNAPGYDGGAFFSPDVTKLVWRASRPTGKALDEYKALLEKNLVRPNEVEIVVAGADGQNPVFVTKNGRANFGPSFLPDSRRVIFSSNLDAAPMSTGGPPNFELYVIDPQGQPGPAGTPVPERITFSEEFDGFPMFSPDGEHLVFASNRFAAKRGETNLFVARWVE